MRRPKVSKKCPSLRTIRSSLTLACSSVRRRRAVTLSIGPPSCALVGKKAAPSHSRPALSNMVLISPQSTSSPTTCRKVEHTGTTLFAPIVVRMTSMVKALWRRTMSASQVSNSVGRAPALAFDKRQLRNILLEQRPERPLVPGDIPAFESGERARDLPGRRLLRRRTACKDRSDDIGKASQCLAAGLAVAVPAQFDPHRRQSIGKGGLLVDRRGHCCRYWPH